MPNIIQIDTIEIIVSFFFFSEGTSMTIRQVIIGAAGLLFFGIGMVVLKMYGQQLPWPTPSLFTPTATLRPEEGYEAVTTANTGCFDWSNTRLTDIDVFEQVSVRGRNKDGTWYIVRWPKFTMLCWVQSAFLKPSNFNPEDLFEIPESFPPATLTPTLTPTPTITATIMFTDTPVFTISYTTPTLEQTKSPRTPTSTLTFTSTPTHTSTSTTTYTPTITYTVTATYTPTLTSTRTPTPLPPCSRPAAPSLSLDPRGKSLNIDLTWSSVADATNYEVFRSVGSIYSSVGTTNKTYMKDSLPKKGAYRYFVIAINSCGESDHSNTVEISR